MQDRLAVAAEALHSEGGDATPLELGQHLLLEAAIGAVETVERHLHGVERKAVRQHLEVDRRMLVAGESDESHLAVLLRLRQGLDDTAAGEVQLRVVLVDDLVDLPEVEMIRSQPRQRVVELTHRDLPVAAVRTHLGHQEDLVAPALQRVPQPLLAPAVVVLPGVVEECQARVDRLVDEGDRVRQRGHGAEVIAAEPEDRDALARAAERPTRDRRRGAGKALQEAPAIYFVSHVPLPYFSMSVTSRCVGSIGKPCGMRVTGLSYRSETLYGSQRPSAAVGAQRARRSSIAAAVIGVKPRAIARFW